MLSQEENAFLTRVGPGTPMGNLMRQYWLPAMLSSELPRPDSDPVRVLLLGERLIAFRDTNGSVGLVDHACPHRGASLFFGRNEESGLRCVYHGWKFDASGQCIDMPNEPAESDFRNKVRARAYPTRERGGIVWAYLGPRSAPPPLPAIEANLLPDGEWTVSAQQQECNWLQILEGDIDTSHFGFLHRGSVRAEAMPPWTSRNEYYVIRNRAPHYRVVDTEYGTMYGAYVEAEPGYENWRIALFLLPFYSKPPGGGPGVLCRVPMDDYHTLNIRMGARGGRTIVPTEVASDPAYARLKSGLVPNTTDWYGRFRMGSNVANDFEIDRDLQRRNEGNNGYTGVVGNMQDPMITASMGPIQDRTAERLASSDTMIIRTRRRLLTVARALAEHDIAPPGVDDPDLYLVRSTQAILPVGADWIEATGEQRRVTRSGQGLEAAARDTP
ncbi:MAG: Rieske 2Fe-2S domain-containing protein [Mycobacterium sp.]|nr:Rieske 2Fe-2S domain-containing protein [Mycobacterium sp.]